MSRHVPRHERWSKHGPNEYRSGGAAVRFEKGAWWAWVTYQLTDPEPGGDVLPEWHDHCDRLGPFKRPRNAMIAAEQHALFLRRRNGDNLRLDRVGKEA
jgi:hypothetical protein